jgi:hypothetical protein
MQGLSLVEVTLLISLAGVLLAVFVPAFLDALRTSKVSEAPFELARIHAAAAAYYATPQSTPSGKRIACLPQSAGPTPALPSAEPVAVDFAASDTPGAGTWQALGYQPAGAIRYRYTLQTGSPGCGIDRPSTEAAIDLRAEGDLDADGALSTFERAARAVDAELVLQPMLRVHDRIE